MLTNPIEKQLIGILLRYQRAFAEVAPVLSAESFADPQAARAWRCFAEMEQRGMPIDIAGLYTVAREILPAEDVKSDFHYWSEAVRECASDINLLPTAHAVADAAQRRRLTTVAEQLSRDAADATRITDDIIASAGEQLLSIQSSSSPAGPIPLSEAMSQSLEHIRIHMAEGRTITGVPTGYPELDNATLGLQPTDLIIIAARPSQGKTTLGLNIALRMAQDGSPVAFFSIEMGRQQIALKCMSALHRIPHTRLRGAHISSAELERLSTDSLSLKGDGRGSFYLIDSPSLTIAEIRRQARILVRDQGVRCIFVDYLQLIRPASHPGRYHSREQEVAQISQGLKSIAKELDIPVVALAQMNRSVEQRRQEGGRPQLSDLRESGAIEQDADIIGFIHRLPEPESPQGTEPSGKKSVIALILAKHRNGICTDLLFDFEPEFSSFSEHHASPAEQFTAVAYDQKIMETI